MNKKILIVYYTDSGSTKEVATVLATQLQANIVNIYEIKETLNIEEDFIIFCTPNKFGKPAKPLINFITANKKELIKRKLSVCFTCMDCYDYPENEQNHSCMVYKDSWFSKQTKELKTMNSWEKSHSVSVYLDTLKQLLHTDIHSIAFFKGKLSFKNLKFFDALTMRFISFIKPTIKQGYYLKKEDIKSWAEVIMK